MRSNNSRSVGWCVLGQSPYNQAYHQTVGWLCKNAVAKRDRLLPASLAAAGGATGLVSRGVTEGVGNFAGDKLLDIAKSSPALSEEQMTKLVKRLRAAGGMKTLKIKIRHFYENPTAEYAQNLIDSTKDKLYLSPSKGWSNPFIVGHEVGHSLHRRNLGSRWVARASHLGQLPGTGLLPWGILAAGTLVHGKEDPELNITQKAALPFAALQAAAVQAEELRATLLSKKLLNKLNIRVPDLGRMIRYQQLNYGLHGLAGLLPLAGVTYGLHRAYKTRREAPEAVPQQGDI